MSRYDPQAGLYVGGPDFGVPAAAPPPCTDAELETLVRFEHPRKLLAVAELPGAAELGEEALGAAYRAPAAEVRVVRARLRRQVATAARALLGEAPVVDAVRRFPVAPGGTVAALGDSITDDHLSWAEILRECLTLVRPDEAIAVVNAGVSGDTTADACRRLHGVVCARPDLVVTMLGTNDCQRHGPALELLVAPDETARNLRCIEHWLAAAGARTAWITPPPVLDTALERAVGDRPFRIRDRDVRAVAELVHGLGAPVVDLHGALGAPPPATLLMDDGVHPSLAGQTAITRAVLGALASPGGQAAVAASASSQNHSGAGKP